MRKIMSILLCVCAVIYSYAGNGSSCTNAIKIDKGENPDFQYSVSGAQTVWFTAQTFDLPLKVSFMPQSGQATDANKPDVYMDFTCSTQGVYDHPILCELFCPNSGSGISIDMPYKAVLTKEGNSWTISMGKYYRDLLLSAGIDENVDVFVRVEFKSAGTLALVPDTEFSDCMDGGKFMKLGDTIHIKANDTERYFILPFAQWSEDSIRISWTGDKPWHFAFASVCQFDPNNISDPNIVDQRGLPDIQILTSSDTVSYKAEEIRYYVEFGEKKYNAQAGMYYGRVLSDGDGILKIERIPVAPPDGDATLLRYGKATTIFPNDTLALYALRRDTVGLRFDCPTQHIVKMYLGKTASFTPATAFASYQYDITSEGHSLFLDSAAISELWKLTTDNYLYVRFQVTARTTVTPRIWRESDCAKKWDRLKTGKTTIERNEQVYYRLYYNEWKGGDMKFYWEPNSGTNACIFWVGDTCQYALTTQPLDAHVVWRKSITRKSNNMSISSTDIQGWANRVDDEGNLYVHFESGTSGSMTISSTAPAETDPVYPAATIAVVCEGTKVLVKASKAQPIVVKNLSDVVVAEWDAVVGETHELQLSSGTYILEGTIDGKIERIQINL